MKYALLLLTCSVFAISGCAMMTAWKSIPAPGGCDQCHKVAISTNWQVTYQAAMISDERGRLPFQTPEYNQSILRERQAPQDSKIVEEKACFDCHKAPTPAHKQHKGRFHH